MKWFDVKQVDVKQVDVKQVDVKRSHPPENTQKFKNGFNKNSNVTVKNVFDGIARLTRTACADSKTAVNYWCACACNVK